MSLDDNGFYLKDWN